MYNMWQGHMSLSKNHAVKALAVKFLRKLCPKKLIENINVIGESPKNMFITHKKYIKKAKKLCEKGYDDD